MTRRDQRVMAVVGRMDVDEAMQEHLRRSGKESSRSKYKKYNQTGRLHYRKRCCRNGVCAAADDAKNSICECISVMRNVIQQRQERRVRVNWCEAIQNVLDSPLPRSSEGFGAP